MHKVQGQITIYTPDPHALPDMKPACDLGTLHAKLIQEGNIPVNLMYNGVHYNPIVHDNMQLKLLSEYRPDWETHPPPKRKRQCQGELASATNDHKSNDSIEQSTEPESRKEENKHNGHHRQRNRKKGGIPGTMSAT